MTTPDPYKTMRAIGKPYGLTSHEVGRILVSARLRSRDGRPTFSATEQGLAAAYDLGYSRHGWKWHEEVVAELLDEWLETQPADAVQKKRRGA
jgi:hypothetical protein